MRLPPQLRVALGPSRLARAFVLSIALSTAGVVIATPAPGWMRVATCLALAAWAWRRWRAFGPHPARGHPVEITLAGNRLIAVREPAIGLRAGFVRDLTFVGHRVTAIVWRPDGARRSRAILVLPDMLPAEDFRRLRVLLRYGRSDEVAGAPASHA